MLTADTEPEIEAGIDPAAAAIDTAATLPETVAGIVPAGAAMVFDAAVPATDTLLSPLNDAIAAVHGGSVVEPV
jgi:hypothetical protein